MSVIDNLKQKMGDVKTRTLLLFVGAILIVGVIAAVSLMGGEKTISEEAGVSHAKAIPKGISSAPGLNPNATEYNAMQYQENEQRAANAENKGSSSIATVVGDQLQSKAQVASLEPKPAGGAAENPEADYRRRLLEQEQRAAQQQSREQLTKDQQQAQAKQDAYEALMTKQAQALFASWQPPLQVYVGGSGVHGGPGGGGGGGGGGEHGTGGPHAGAPVQPHGPVVYKAGEIVYAVLETSVDSDEPGPVLAKIVSGTLAGSKIMGSLTLAGQNAQKVMLQFSVLNDPKLPHSVSMNAVAIDLETARTALATDVDNHYLQRYGVLFASSFMQGVGQSVNQSVQTPGVTVDPSTGITTVAAAPSTTHQQILTGLGQIGTTMGQNLTTFTNVPPTVTVDAGTSMGILFLSDLTLDQPVKPLGTLQVNTGNQGPPPLHGPVATQPVTTQAVSTANGPYNTTAPPH